MNKIFYLILCALWLYVCPLQAADDIRRMAGCWNDTTDNSWTYGFFEHFAIWQNTFWEYEKISLHRKKGEIILRNGDERVRLKLKLPKGDGGPCTIASDRYGTSVVCRQDTLPTANRPDNTPFAPNNLRADSAVIQGYLPSCKGQATVRISVDYPLSEDRITLEVSTDSLGRFATTVPVIGVTAASIHLTPDEPHLPVILKPRGSLMLYAGSNGQVFMMGRNARLNQEIRYMEEHAAPRPLPDWHAAGQMTPAAWKATVLDWKQTADSLLTDAAEKRPALSQRCRHYLQDRINARCAAALMERSATLSRRHLERFDAAYLHTVDSLLEQAQPPCTLTREWLEALRSYSHYHAMPLPVHVFKGEVTLTDYLAHNGLYPFTPQERSDVELYSKGLDMATFLDNLNADSLTRAARMTPYLAAMKRAENLFRKPAVRRLMDQHRDKTDAWELRNELKKQLKPLEHLQMPTGMRELFAASVFTARLDYNKAPFPTEVTEYIQTVLTDCSLYDYVDRRQQYYQQLTRQPLPCEETLKDASALDSIESAARIWDHIVSPLKGKIVYADIWGTWCGPCKWQMEAVPALKASLKREGKDGVVFLYISIFSPEESWRNVLKEYHLTDPNSVHYNLSDEVSQKLMKHLGISCFPTYLVIDRENNIIDRHPPAPQDGSKLTDYLRQLAR